ncbi:MAG: N-acetylgalactosamine 6-sulfate sulfatase, partial [Planctomycetia bacterium]|nr:N-acetylgalactosamine 6-sulfate sulfatase [Planctomycetia bacterium]
MRTRNLVFLLCLLFSWVLTGPLSAWAVEQPKKTNPPNIVIFLADDQGWGDLS